METNHRDIRKMREQKTIPISFIDQQKIINKVRQERRTYLTNLIIRKIKQAYSANE